MPCGIGWFRRTLALKSAMGRIHLFEWEDLSWFPKNLRDYGTDFLEFLAQKTGLFQPAVPVLSKALKRLETNQIIDLASGGGGEHQDGEEEEEEEEDEVIEDLEIIQNVLRNFFTSRVQ